MNAVLDIARRPATVVARRAIDAQVQRELARSMGPRPASPLARDVLAGLARPQKSVPACWLYDARGRALLDHFGRCEVLEAPPSENWILERCAAQIAQSAGTGATVIELGRVCADRTAILLAALHRPAGYVSIALEGQAGQGATGDDVGAGVGVVAGVGSALTALRADFPSLAVHGVETDFLQLTRWPAAVAEAAEAAEAAETAAARGGRQLVFVPGSLIGHFSPESAIALLARIGRMVGPRALLVVGVDACNEAALLLPVHDDARGRMAAFNKNLLSRINRELGADFSLNAFRHEARHNAREQRIELHLVSRYAHRVTVLGRRFAFDTGESIHTADFHQFALARFQAMVRRSGWVHQQLWMDAASRYGVHVLARAA